MRDWQWLQKTLGALGIALGPATDRAGRDKFLQISANLVRLTGVLGGMTLPSKAFSTLSTISRQVAAIMILGGSMVSLTSESGDHGWRRDKASSLTFLELGR